MADNWWLDEKTPRDRAIQRMWQGGTFLVIGLIVTATTRFACGFVVIWTIAIAVIGLFWLLVGLITFLTGYE